MIDPPCLGPNAAQPGARHVLHNNARNPSAPKSKSLPHTPPPHTMSSSTAAVGKRLIIELAKYRKELNPCLASLGPVSEDDLTHWIAVLKGAEGTPYEGGQWKIDVKIPINYPHAPPTMKFLTPICHPNIHLKVRPHLPPPPP